MSPYKFIKSLAEQHKAQAELLLELSEKVSGMEIEYGDIISDLNSRIGTLEKAVKDKDRHIKELETKLSNANQPTQ